MSGGGFFEVLVFLVYALLPILAIGLFIYLIVRLAIRHEHRNHER